MASALQHVAGQKTGEEIALEKCCWTFAAAAAAVRVYCIPPLFGLISLGG